MWLVGYFDWQQLFFVSLDTNFMNCPFLYVIKTNEHGIV